MQPSMQRWQFHIYNGILKTLSNHVKDRIDQGSYARKVNCGRVFSVYILKPVLFGRKSKHKTDVPPWHGIHFHKNNLWNILDIGKLICEFSKLSKFNAFNHLGYQKNTDASILVYKFRPKRTGFISICTQSIRDHY